MKALLSRAVGGPETLELAEIADPVPGTGEAPAAPVFIDGAKALTLRGPGIAEDFKKLVIDYVERRFGRQGVAAE